MQSLSFEQTVRVDPSTAWDVLVDPAAFEAAAPNLRTVELPDGGVHEGAPRRCVDTSGRVWIETCTVWEPERRYAVEVHVAESPVHRPLFHAFAGEWAMEERPDGVLVTMTFDYEPRYGPFGWVLGKVGEREGRRLTEAIFDGWEHEIEARRTAVATER